MSAHGVDLTKLKLAQLRALKRDVETSIATAEKTEKADVAAQLRAQARELGFDIEDLFGSSGSRRTTRGESSPKYRNPENHADTWSGRGRKPRWFAEAIENGVSAESMAI